MGSPATRRRSKTQRSGTMRWQDSFAATRRHSIRPWLSPSRNSHPEWRPLMPQRACDAAALPDVCPCTGNRPEGGSAAGTAPGIATTAARRAAAGSACGTAMDTSIGRKAGPVLDSHTRLLVGLGPHLRDPGGAFLLVPADPGFEDLVGVARCIEQVPQRRGDWTRPVSDGGSGYLISTRALAPWPTCFANALAEGCQRNDRAVGFSGQVRAASHAWCRVTAGMFRTRG